MNTGSAHTVRDLIIDRLATRVYPIGSKLPTARELAAELGVHRNTVAKAYRLLADLGLVTTSPGRGTFVTAQAGHGQDGRGTLLLRVENAVGDLVLSARRLGLDASELRALVEAKIGAIYASSGRRGAFVECNRPDVEGHITEVESLTRIRLSPLLLDQALADIDATSRDFDVIFTSLFHVKELADRLGSVRPDLRIIGLYASPDEQALEAIARIRPGSRVTVIASNPAGGHRFASLVQTYAQVGVEISTAPSDEQIRALIRTCDVLVCTRSREAQVRALGLPIPVIALPFHISPQAASRVTEALLGDGSSTPGMRSP